jgi:hypothetical protein
MNLHISSSALLIAAAVFYVSVLSSLIVMRRPWMDIFVVGAVVTFWCFTIDLLIPPFGLVTFAAFHAVWDFHADSFRHAKSGK